MVRFEEKDDEEEVNFFKSPFVTEGTPVSGQELKNDKERPAIPAGGWLGRRHYNIIRFSKWFIWGVRFEADVF